MKTLEELYNELAASDELKKEFLALKTPEEVAAFAKKHGCDATFEDIKAFFSEEPDKEGELSEDELENVAGGRWWVFDVIISIGKGQIFCKI